jgi:hypothetical protein
LLCKQSSFCRIIFVQMVFFLDICKQEVGFTRYFSFSFWLYSLFVLVFVGWGTEVVSRGDFLLCYIGVVCLCLKS